MERATEGEGQYLDLRTVKGAGLRKLREARGLRQEDLAETARFAGLAWTRATVASVEIGRRDLALEELLLLSMALECDLADFFDGPDGAWVQVTPDARASLKEVRARLRGGGHGQSRVHWEVPGYSPNVEEFAGFLEFEPYEILWPTAPKADALAVARAAEAEAEQHLARTLGVSPVAVAVAAFGQWGHGLSAERDRIIAERSPRGSLQTTRGHVTRSLVGEITPQLQRFAIESNARHQAILDAHDRVTQAMEPDRGPGLTIPEGAEVIAHWKNQPTAAKKPTTTKKTTKRKKGTPS